MLPVSKQVTGDDVVTCYPHLYTYLTYIGIVGNHDRDSHEPINIIECKGFEGTLGSFQGFIWLVDHVEGYLLDNQNLNRFRNGHG